MTQTNKKNYLSALCRGVTALAVILGLTNIVVSNQLSTEGGQLAQFSSEIIQLEKEASFLNQEIAAASSLASLETNAKLAGFVNVDKPLALSTPEPVALAQ